MGQWPGEDSIFIEKLPAEQQGLGADLLPLYRRYSQLFNLRLDFLWAQMMLETNGLRFTGQVTGAQNNYCGLKTTDGRGFASFATPALGVIAHCAHVAWYVYPEHYNDLCSIIYDPRHQSYHRYSVKVLGDMGAGNWTDSLSYAKNILRVWNKGL